MVTATKGKIGVLIEDHFDPTEYLKFNEFFPQKGYEVEYITHLWGNKELHFGSNPENNIVGEQVTVSTEVNDVKPSDYKGIICIGAYAMDRLRYQVNPKKGEPNQAPAVAFLRKAVNTENVKLGAICHSLWLFCADNEIIKNKKVTCAHNIICDVENAGADVIFDGDQTADLVIDGNLITAKHPGVTDEFMEKFVEAIEA
ncbi:MAG: thiamine biosynthesis protein ThiJ [Okeania sp. SIO3H1]|uniref:DJ-1/PfpI family protein n=1 Tax=Okeania sp. SIO1I7 TaxID=2607772 RepID=UPI0013CCEFA8|nr:DJ-1/PfpI family protein [Okeania sp. SIO1I7]NEN88325.1 thiamine biosynthesis protein ThiJ [Okeania sp. SIO3H1]NET27189.1 thiamine biosynthesis protein ThiJ [Okeania sp. SIO1I7]